MGCISKNISDIILILVYKIVGKIHLATFKSLASVLFISESITYTASLLCSHSMYLSHLLPWNLCNK